MTNGAGWPMGPCTLLDLVGIDVHVHASEALYEKLREPRMAPAAAARGDAERRAARPQGGTRVLRVRRESARLADDAGLALLAVHRFHRDSEAGRHGRHQVPWTTTENRTTTNTIP